jgi:predicted flavoprotein YhiN
MRGPCPGRCQLVAPWLRRRLGADPGRQGSRHRAIPAGQRRALGRLVRSDAAPVRAAAETVRGECVIGARGLEGSAVYALSPVLRDGAALSVDLCPDLDAPALATRLARLRSNDSVTTRLRKLGLSPAAVALVMECARDRPFDTLKKLVVPHQGVRPMDEAISVAGGIRADALDAGLQLRALPGVFAAGEMLDWEAPTGGYLLTACLATGRWAGRAAAGSDPAGQ